MHPLQQGSSSRVWRVNALPDQRGDQVRPRDDANNSFVFQNRDRVKLAFCKHREEHGDWRCGNDTRRHDRHDVGRAHRHFPGRVDQSRHRGPKAAPQTLGIFTRAPDQVNLKDDPEKPIPVLSDRERRETMLAQKIRDFCERRIWTDSDEIARHDIGSRYWAHAVAGSLHLRGTDQPRKIFDT